MNVKDKHIYVIYCQAFFESNSLKLILNSIRIINLIIKLFYLKVMLFHNLSHSYLLYNFYLITIFYIEHKLILFNLYLVLYKQVH
jgi:hypothetical protein